METNVDNFVHIAYSYALHYPWKLDDRIFFSQTRLKGSKGYILIVPSQNYMIVSLEEFLIFSLETWKTLKKRKPQENFLLETGYKHFLA